MKDITQSCRDINELNPLAQVLLNLALDEIKKNGINPLLVETYRPQERQNYLYCMGRNVEECVTKGISKSFAQKYCTLSKGKVTWTTNSVHKDRNAVDLIPQRNGKAIWNSKDKETVKLISIMEKYGWQAGINFKSSPDSPHFQLDNVSIDGKVYSSTNNNKFITLIIQKALNKELGIKLVCDGKWGASTTDAVNDFRVKNGWDKTDSLGATALKKLLS